MQHIQISLAWIGDKNLKVQSHYFCTDKATMAACYVQNHLQDSSPYVHDSLN